MPTIKAQLVSYREDVGGYIIYVFTNLEFKSLNQKYVMTTRLPNWESPYIDIGDIGYLSYREVVAGEDTWWDKLSQTRHFYNYNNCLFEDFVHEKKPSLDKPIVL